MQPKAIFLLIASTALAHAAPATQDASLQAYLDTLRAIAPAARDGADAYLAAHLQRCGRRMSAAALREAVAHGEGEPVLMAMMRAASVRDTAALQQLARTVPCAGQL